MESLCRAGPHDVLVEKACTAQSALFLNPQLAKHYQEPFPCYPAQWLSPASTGTAKMAKNNTACCKFKRVKKKNGAAAAKELQIV